MSHQILYVWLRSIFITYHLAADRLDMGHAVEVRYPFLDHVLFENLRDIPVQAMGYENTQKYLLRHAASIWLPEENWQAPKQPFYAPPMTRNSRNNLLTLAQDILRGPALQAIPFFNQNAVLGLLNGINDLPRLEQLMLDPLLLMMTSLCLIQQAYKL